MHKETLPVINSAPRAEGKLGYEALVTEAQRLMLLGLTTMRDSASYREALFFAHVKGQGNGPISIAAGGAIYEFKIVYTPGEFFGVRIGAEESSTSLVIPGVDYSGVDGNVVIKDIFSDPGQYYLEIDREMGGETPSSQRVVISKKRSSSTTLGGNFNFQQSTFDPETKKPLIYEYFSDDSKAAQSIENFLAEYRNSELSSAQEIEQI